MWLDGIGYVLEVLDEHGYASIDAHECNLMEDDRFLRLLIVLKRTVWPFVDVVPCRS